MYGSLSFYFSSLIFIVCSKKYTDNRRNSLNQSSAVNVATETTTAASSKVPSVNETTIVAEGHNTNCSVCRQPFVTSNNSGADSSNKNFVTCNVCSSQICKINPNCSVWLPKYNHWECSDCHQFNTSAYVHAYDWIFERLTEKFRNKKIVTRATADRPSHELNRTSENDVMLELNGNFNFML